MEKMYDWSAPILAASSRLFQSILNFLPQLLGAIAILILGWIVARLFRSLTLRLLQSLDRLSGMFGLGNALAGKQVSTSVAPIIGNVVFWLVILIFLASATNMLGLSLFSGWLDRVISHLPNILSGALIIFAGSIFGNLVGDAVRTATQSMPARQRTLLARAAQLFTVGTMIVIGVDQIGIDISVLITIIAISIGALLGGVAIAFSLGSKTLVSNLIGAHYLSKDYRVGETIRVGDILGTILEISPVAIILETSEGRMSVPAKIFGEQASLLLSRESSDAR